VDYREQECLGGLARSYVVVTGITYTERRKEPPRVSRPGRSSCVWGAGHGRMYLAGGGTLGDVSVGLGARLDRQNTKQGNGRWEETMDTKDAVSMRSDVARPETKRCGGFGAAGRCYCGAADRPSFPFGPLTIHCTKYFVLQLTWSDQYQSS
jgi:hypothetical protein